MTIFRCILSVTVLAGCIFLYTACNMQTRKTPPAAYFVRLYDSVNQKYGYSENALHFLDSIFVLYPDADPTTRFNYYGYTCAYYHIYKNDNKKAMVYADSLLWLVRKNPDIKDYDR